MARKEARGLELAMMIEDEADHMLVAGGTGPMIAQILRQYATQIRQAPDFGSAITESMLNKEVHLLMVDLQAALGFLEFRSGKRKLGN